MNEYEYINESLTIVIIFFAVIVFCIILTAIINNKNKNYIVNVDMSGKRRKENLEDYIDLALIQDRELINKFKEYKQKRIEEYNIKHKKIVSQTEFKREIEEEPIIIQVIRKYSNGIVTVDEVIEVDLKKLEKINKQLELSNWTLTRTEYNSKNQRKLMTKELRNKIKARDNYTCQICGKQMFDEVGLHIDHIIPVSQGGKTIESNLQVLCDKCNLRKGNRK